MDSLKLIKSGDTNLNPLSSQRESPIGISKNESLKAKIAKSIAIGECTIPEDLVKLFNISYEQIITLLSDPGFTNLVANFTKAKLNLNFHSRVVPRLMEILESEDNKESMSAAKLIAQLSNNLKSQGTDVNINLNLENLVRESEKNIPSFTNPIIDLEKVG